MKWKWYNTGGGKQWKQEDGQSKKVKKGMGVDLRIYQKRIPKLKTKGAREIGTHL